MEGTLALLIPLIAVSIPLVAVAGRFVIRPLIEVLERAVRAGDASPEAEARIRQLEARVEELERVTRPALDELEFQRQLRSSKRSDAVRSDSEPNQRPEATMSSQPPKPASTDPNQHAPGVSRTLETNAERARREHEKSEEGPSTAKFPEAKEPEDDPEDAEK